MSYAVAVIGLGAMGMGAAQSCVRAGLDTYGVDLSAQARDVLQAAGAKAVAASAGGFADKLDAVLLLVVNAAQVEAVLFGWVLHSLQKVQFRLQRHILYKSFLHWHLLQVYLVRYQWRLVLLAVFLMVGYSLRL